MKIIFIAFCVGCLMGCKDSTGPRETVREKAVKTPTLTKWIPGT